MKFFKIFLFVLFILDISFAQQSDYFPLNIYDKRIYDNFEEETVIDTSIMNGKKYYLFDNFRISNNVYFRQESSKVYYYTDTTEYLVYDFSANIGDSWICPEPNSTEYGPIELISRSDTVITPSGTYENCYQFSHFLGYDYAYQEWLAPEIGLVQRNYNFFVPSIMKLVEYSNILEIDDELSKIPTNYTIEPIYSNPFNSSTNLSFKLYKNSIVKISIYNIAGQQIQNILDSYLKTGSHTIQWNADNFSSGVYLAKFIINNNITHQKTILLK